MGSEMGEGLSSECSAKDVGLAFWLKTKAILLQRLVSGESMCTSILERNVLSLT